MQCGSCGQNNRDGAKFCDSCGGPLSSGCSSCGTELREGAKFCDSCGTPVGGQAPAPTSSNDSSVNQPTTSDSEISSLETELTSIVPPARVLPDTFDNGRYQVQKFLGEGGKKMVYLAHDETLDRDVAFALIKTEGLDTIGLTRISREAQAMGRLGSHPHIVTVFDLGQHEGQPYMVTELMGGGDVEGVIEDAPSSRLSLEQCIDISIATSRGLEFAHSKGIVHRDLKPGNVWLTSDGIAKIGDFGLAVASDKSRLTQEGMMVGTVSYMPPEQAMGGEVTQRADLYSLGAMMYEMVTGRPPFLGDDSIAIIGQHINTPPVAPTWHSSNCPRPLEALILRLLAKNPAERPESATDVLTVLEGLELPGSGEGPSPTLATDSTEQESNVLDGVASGVFVGRQQEMGDLKASLEDVLSGKGRMITLVGEPGIGKTRTSQELATYAGLRGAKVLWGRCYEDQGVPPYWPWVQAIRTYVRDEDPQKLSTEMGAGAADISEVIPDVRTQLPGLQPAPQIDPEQARFRLFDSITAFLRSASQTRPLVIVLDDLHWADRQSLLLLQFIAKEIGNSRLLLLGTYRDMELSRQHPLSETLGELNRERSFQRVLLRGLTQEDVQRFIEVAAGVDPDLGLVNAVYTQTEGNPLFVTEVVRLLVQEGQLDQATNLSTTGRQTDSWAVRIPEGVREVIGRRLNKLTDRCNETLTIASIVGREFDFDQLKVLVDDLSDDMLLDVLEEALAGRVIEEMPDAVGRYQFTHALLQETLMDELSLTRRVRLHARIAESLEAMYGSDAEQHAAELAFHYEQGQAMVGTEKLIEYSVIAGNASLNALALEEGRAHFELALNSLNDGTDAHIKAEVLFGYGKARQAFVTEGEFQYAFDRMKDAYEAFKSIGAFDRAASAASQLNINLVRFSRGSDELLRDSVQYSEEGSSTKASILALLGLTEFLYNNVTVEAERLLDESIVLSTALDDKPVQAFALSAQSEIRSRNLDLDGAREKAIRALELSKQVGDGTSAASALYVLSTIYWMDCDVEGIESLSSILEDLQTNGIRLPDSYHSHAEAFLSWAQGDSIAINNMYAKFRENNLSFSQAVESAYLLELGEDEKGKEQLDNVINYATSTENTVFAHFLQELAWGSFLLGTEEYAKQAQLLLPRVQNIDVMGNVQLVTVPMSEAFIAVALGDSDLAREAYEKLKEAPDIISIMQSVSRAKGLLARMIGKNKEARDHFLEAIEFCETKGMKPELAWSYSDMSELVEDVDGDLTASQQFVEKALTIANDIGMKPLTNRILARRDILKA